MLAIRHRFPRFAPILTLFAATQVLTAAVTLSVTPNVNLPSVNAGTSTTVSDSSAMLSASGTGTAAFTTSISYGPPPVAYKSPQNWLKSVSPSSGNITAGANVPIMLTADPTGLQAGPYTATVTFTAGSSNAKLTVTFNIQGVDLTAGLKAQPTPVAAGLKAQVGEIDVALTNANGTATTQDIQVSTRTDGGNWLLTPADAPLSLTVTGPGVLLLTVDATALAPGSTHSAIVTVVCVNGAPCLSQSLRISVQITYPLPVLSSISPNSAASGSTVTVTLAGSYLTGTTAINTGIGIQVNGFTVVSDTQIIATFVLAATASPGPQTITLTGPGGMSKGAIFTITPPGAPSLTSISPNSGPLGAAVSVILTGTNLAGTIAVNTGPGIAVSGIVAQANNQVSAVFTISASAAPGDQFITVLTPGGISNGLTFTITGAPQTITMVLPQIAAGGSFVTGFSVVNSSGSPANFSISFHDDTGAPISLPFSGGLGVLPTLSDTVPPNGAMYYETGNPNVPDPIGGSAIITADRSITVQALFRRQTSNIYYEAAIPASAGSNEFETPFDATTFATNQAQIYTGFAIANLDAVNFATIICTAWDSQGNVIQNGVTVPYLAPYGHWANYLLPQLLGKRGTIDCISNTKVGAVALRALGAGAISSLPISTKTTSAQPVTAVLPQIAAGGTFVTGFYVVNTGNTPGTFSINFHDDNGAPVMVPFNGGLGALSTLSDTIPPNGANYYEAGDPNNPNVIGGSGVVTSSPSISIQALFRRVTANVYYEAAVPSTAGNNEFEIPFDATTFAPNGAQIYTGFAIANLDSATTANITCNARDSQGNILPNAVVVPSLNPYGHWANYLFPQLTGYRGTIDCTSNTKIGPVALRALGADAISSLPIVPLR